jgi:hypothetical protein
MLRALTITTPQQRLSKPTLLTIWIFCDQLDQNELTKNKSWTILSP